MRFAFVVVYRGATLVTNCLLPLVFQNAVDITWAGFPAALGLLAVDLALFLGDIKSVALQNGK